MIHTPARCAGSYKTIANGFAHCDAVVERKHSRTDSIKRTLAYCGCLMCFGMVIGSYWLSSAQVSRRVAVHRPLSPVSPEALPGSASVGSTHLSGAPDAKSGRTDGTATFRAITERNLFALTPAPPGIVSSEALPQPAADLLLTGLIDLEPVRSALFRLTEPGRPPLYFAVTEGGQNDWLEMLAVDVTHGTVRVRLKRPVVRIRQVGVEVVMSFRMHGAVNSP
jgi:hypothetical protein